MSGSDLFAKLFASARRLLGVRQPIVNDLFVRRLFLWPSMFRVPEMGGREPYAVFNPGALIIGDRLGVFPRVVTGYFWYTSIVGYFELSLDDVLEGRAPSKLIDVRVVIHPSSVVNLAGCEDPRVDKRGDKYYVLYTALQPLRDRVHAVNAVSKQALAVLDEDLRVLRDIVLRIVDKSGRVYEVSEVKDSALLRDTGDGFWILTRPVIEGFAAAWRGLLSLDEGTVDAESLEPVLLPEHWELKVGWSTNALPLRGDKDAYMVAWHGVGRDMVYRTGFAIVSGEGELLGISNYVLEPRAREEFLGERPGVVFGCGLVRYDELLIMVAGFADTGIGVYVAEEDKVLEQIKWLQRN